MLFLIFSLNDFFFCVLYLSTVSAAMALPFSSFPNVNSLLVVDDFQRPYLAVQDFVISGVPMSIATILVRYDLVLFSDIHSNLFCLTFYTVNHDGWIRAYQCSVSHLAI